MYIIIYIRKRNVSSCIAAKKMFKQFCRCLGNDYGHWLWAVFINIKQLMSSMLMYLWGWGGVDGVWQGGEVDR